MCPTRIRTSTTHLSVPLIIMMMVIWYFLNSDQDVKASAVSLFI